MARIPAKAGATNGMQELMGDGKGHSFRLKPGLRTGVGFEVHWSFQQFLAAFRGDFYGGS